MKSEQKEKKKEEYTCKRNRLAARFIVEKRQLGSNRQKKYRGVRCEWG